MTGLTVLGIGLFLLAIGGARYFVARPQPGQEQTAFDRGDYIASRLLLAGGLLIGVIGAVLTIVELLS